MDRQGHDFAAAMAFAQQQQAANVPQQQQFGFHPQHQQFPQAAHGPPFMPPHHSLPQYAYQRPQLHPHHPSHAHLIHQQQSSPAFLPHMPPNFATPPFHGPYDSAPPPPPPNDAEVQKRIDKLVEYVIKNGPGFEAMVREKEQDNPAYSFIFGGEGHNYYRYKLWLATRPPGGPFNPPFPPSSMPMIHPPNPMMTPPLTAPQLNASAAAAAAAAAGPAASMMGAPQMHQPHFPPFHEQQHHLLPQPFVGHGRPDYDQPSYAFKGLAGPLPSDVAMELNNVLNSLTGTKESIKGAKIWFMQRSPFAPALAEALRDRMFALDDSERQLHIIYLANDILFDSLQRRVSPLDLDNEALAFKPVLGSMLARIYHNPQNKEENQSRLQKILQFWASKEVYDHDTICGLENEMMSGPPANSFAGSQKELSPISSDPSTVGAFSQQSTNKNFVDWQPADQSSMSNILDQHHRDKQVSPAPIPPLVANQQFLPSSVPSASFGASVPIPSSAQLANQQAAAPLPASNAGVAEKLPPYPLFPPGLIPGMVRKMQIGSGVPYSPLSPLDIPTVIPPSNVSPSEILESVSKFFREIGEVNPSEGPIKPSESKDEDDEYEREPPIRKGGACIPPPPNLQVDPESGTFADGSVDRKAGSSGSAHLGLGATTNPNEVSQYDDVYTSYRKQRSTTYHSSMSARAAAR